MNQKEYELITKILRWGLTMPNYTDAELEPIRDLAYTFTEHLEATYKSFDKAKFLKGLGL